MADASISRPIIYKDYGALKIISEYQLKVVLENIPIQQLRPEEWKEDVAEEQTYPYVDATPPKLRGVKLRKLFWTETDWKLLTNIRSTSEFDDNFFSRLVELEKFRLYSRAIERRKIKYNREEEEVIVAITAASVSYSSFCRHRLEDADKTVSTIDQLDEGPDLDSITEKESSIGLGEENEI